MDWLQILTLLFGYIIGNAALIVPLWLWNRSEANADRRELRAAMDASQAEMKAEMKDFHGRLCKLEERFINWLTKDDKE
jgi:replication initiation and membrane attachment protein DnaB